MAKFGETKSEYDPFGEISSTLAALSDSVVEEEALGTNTTQSAQTTERVSQQQEIKVPIEEPVRRESSGGGATELQRPLQKNRASQKVASSLALITTKRFKTTQDEALRIDKATLNLAAQLGIRLDASKITRALWETYLTHEQEILRSVDAAEGLTERPPNTDPVALAEFDEKLAELIGEGLMMACMRSHRG